MCGRVEGGCGKSEVGGMVGLVVTTTRTRKYVHIFKGLDAGRLLRKKNRATRNKRMASSNYMTMDKY